jgi:hypothetical protein
LGASLRGACEVRAPGIVMRSPILTLVCGAMLLARAMSVNDLPYMREILIKVSPGATTWTPELFGGALAGARPTGGGNAAEEAGRGCEAAGVCTVPVTTRSAACGG